MDFVNKVFHGYNESTLTKNTLISFHCKINLHTRANEYYTQ